ncbi:CdaR family protein [Mucilaginibacter sp. McL0603]|uniref:CdaR family protein n=1 Tax=Mucilaginibacter sp. McL0603 TaxID=3415670 RepID=UPI003CEDB342
MAFVKLSATERRRLSAFFTCLILAAVAWVFTTLSGTYNFTVKKELSYKNAPEKRAFHSLQPDTINTTMQGTGWQMLFSRMNNEDNTITVDLQTLENKDYVVLSSQLKQINDRKEFDEQIVGFNPDTLYFDFSNRAVKRIPVKLLTDISYQHQFSQSNNVVITPSYVTLSGPANIIDNIRAWNTDSLILDSVNETVRTRVNMQPAKEGNVSIYPKSIQLVLPVDEFTEKTISIPVKLINNQNYYKVKIFPLKVNVTFITSLNRYAEMDEELFEASADLTLWSDRDYTTLPVKLTRIPAYCKIVKIEPQNIDFIVRK